MFVYGFFLFITIRTLYLCCCLYGFKGFFFNISYSCTIYYAFLLPVICLIGKLHIKHIFCKWFIIIRHVFVKLACKIITNWKHIYFIFSIRLESNYWTLFTRFRAPASVSTDSWRRHLLCLHFCHNELSSKHRRHISAAKKPPWTKRL